VPVYAPAGADRRLAAAYDGDAASLDDVFDFRVVTPGTTAIGPFTVETARTAHPVECHAVRLTAGGRSLVYTGDTGPCQRVIDLARGADVLLAEAAHPEAPDLPTGLHLTGREAGQHAAAAGVGRLLITHVPAWVDRTAQLAAAGSVFPATELVDAGAVYDI
jgi:ribonuclease BN (tRNA processing enzyme)